MEIQALQNILKYSSKDVANIIMKKIDPERLGEFCVTGDIDNKCFDKSFEKSYYELWGDDIYYAIRNTMNHPSSIALGKMFVAYIPDKKLIVLSKDASWKNYRLFRVILLSGRIKQKELKEIFNSALETGNVDDIELLLKAGLKVDRFMIEKTKDSLIYDYMFENFKKLVKKYE